MMVEEQSVGFVGHWSVDQIQTREIRNFAKSCEANVGDLRAVQIQPAQVGEIPQLGNPGVSNLRLPEVQYEQFLKMS